MATAHLVSVEEYLHSSFEVDAEYVEGRIASRPMPPKDHSKLQTWLARNLHPIARDLGFEVWVEQRIRTIAQPPRFRVPDLCLTQGEPDEQIFTSPPYLCIEILSPEDSALQLRDKIREYLEFGVPWVWIIDPVSGNGETYSWSAVTRVENGIWRAGEVEVAMQF